MRFGSTNTMRREGSGSGTLGLPCELFEPLRWASKGSELKMGTAQRMHDLNQRAASKSSPSARARTARGARAHMSTVRCVNSVRPLLTTPPSGRPCTARRLIRAGGGTGQRVDRQSDAEGCPCSRNEPQA